MLKTDIRIMEKSGVAYGRPLGVPSAAEGWGGCLTAPRRNAGVPLFLQVTYTHPNGKASSIGLREIIIIIIINLRLLAADDSTV